jgi:ankyrin repeat protein
MDLWQFTPLHEAASKNRVDVCSLLLAHGADPTLLNCHSKSALDAAPSRELAEKIQCIAINYLLFLFKIILFDTFLSLH